MTMVTPYCSEEGRGGLGGKTETQIFIANEEEHKKIEKRKWLEIKMFNDNDKNKYLSIVRKILYKQL